MKTLILISLVLLVGCQSPTSTSERAERAQPTVKLPTTIEEAVASSFRDPENRKRDVYRHPVETLTFFGLKPNMNVIEISPGSGWYMEILAPLLNAEGQYTAALPASTNDYVIKMNEKVNRWLESNPQLAGKARTTAFAPPNEIAPAGSADMVLTFRNVHNWMNASVEQAAFNAFYKVLKPGGILGVVEHRASSKGKWDPKAKSGYVREKDVITFAERAGFKLDAKSEINANPKDTKNYPDGVWTLPPVLRLKEKNRDKYLAIGESDRMTLRFVKPATP